MVLGAITPGSGPSNSGIVQPSVATRSQVAAPSYVPDTARAAASPEGQQTAETFIKKYGPYVAIGILLLLLLNKNN